MVQCLICNKNFSRKDSYKRHQLQHLKSKTKLKCNKCRKLFTSVNYLQRHLRVKHVEPSTSNTTNLPVKRKAEQTNNYKGKKKRKLQAPNDTIHCDSCKMNVMKRFYTAHLKTNKHKSLSSVMYRSNNIELIKSAFKSRIQSFKIINLNKKELIFLEFFNKIKKALIVLIEEHIKVYTTIKVNIELFGLYVLKKTEDVIETDIKSFNTKYKVITQSINLNEFLNTWFEVIKTKSEEFNEQNSGWSLLEILHLEININKYNPLRASAYVRLPKNISKKQAVVNVVNSDDNCFAYAIMSALFPSDSNINYINDYPPFNNHLNLNGLSLPMKFTEIEKFEELNQISINVFGLDQSKKEINGPLHHTKYRREKHINLLYYEYRKKHISLGSKIYLGLQVYN